MFGMISLSIKVIALSPFFSVIGKLVGNHFFLFCVYDNATITKEKKMTKVMTKHHGFAA